MKPLLEMLDYDLSIIEKKKDMNDSDPYQDYELNFKLKNQINIAIKIIEDKYGFDDKNPNNCQNLSHHDICQQIVNSYPELNWIIISNGKQIRLITKYFYSFSKGYLQFNLDSIFTQRDLSEFILLYNLMHSSRFLIKNQEKKSHNTLDIPFSNNEDDSTPENIDNEIEENYLIPTEIKLRNTLIDLFLELSQKEGVKIGDSLRDNVHDAIEMLGNELIQQNNNFYIQIKNGKINLKEYFSELLRIVYRIIFILYAEQRNMMPGSGSLYFKHFSLTSLRILSERNLKVDKNHDLWQKLQIIFNLVREGNILLKVPCFNGRLFDDNYPNTLIGNYGIPIIRGNNLKLSNSTLLKIIKLLTSSKIDNTRQRINFKEISEEEIGAIYESLLDFYPRVNNKLEFELSYQTTERKSTGSYYTPKSLIDLLIKTTLEPCVNEKLRKAKNEGKDLEETILELKICDPACGGGSFLLSACDFLGEKLAYIRNDNKTPSDDELRNARRDVLQHCIYGVDKNPLAIELAKISLWLRACVKDKPLNYLDNHLKFGNSLIGFGKKSIITEIPKDAFSIFNGNKETGLDPENKILINKAKQYLSDELKIEKKVKGLSKITEFFGPSRNFDSIFDKFKNIIDASENNPEDIELKEKNYKKLYEDSEIQELMIESNLWTAAFYWTFEAENITKQDIPNFTLIQELRKKLISQSNKTIDKANDIAKENLFFHWFLEFPEVFFRNNGGFDCILGNPPWDVLEFKENEFFAGINDEILHAGKQSERRKLISQLKNTNQELFIKYKNAFIKMYKTRQYLINSGLYPLSAKGKLNLAMLFTERNWNLTSNNGYMGLVLPTKIISGFSTQYFFQNIIENKLLASMFDFINIKPFFNNISSNQRFCLLTLNTKNNIQFIPMTFLTTDEKTILEALNVLKSTGNENFIQKLPLESKLIPILPTDFSLFNPNTLTCPVFNTILDSLIMRKMYENASVLVKRDIKTSEIVANPWKIGFHTFFNAASDSDKFKNQIFLSKVDAKPLSEKYQGGVWCDSSNYFYYPLYGGKMIWIYDHRYQYITKSEGVQRTEKSVLIDGTLKRDPYFLNFSLNWITEEDFKISQPKNWNYKWYIGFRDITGTNNERTFVAAIIPYVPSNHTLPIIISQFEPAYLCCLLANLNCIMFDYLSRQKITGNHMSFFIVEQFPVFSPEKYKKALIEKISSLVLKLSYNSIDLQDFAKDLNYNGPPIIYNEEERIVIQAELNAIYAKLYKLSKEELNHIFDSFPTLQKNEFTIYSEYRIKRLTLEKFDSLTI